MATSKKQSSTATKAPAARKAAATGGTVKPVKETMTKTELANYLAEASGVEARSVKAVLASLEATILGSVHKKGAREFTLPGLLKLSVQNVPAKKKRFGKDPFTGEERWFEPKPASVRIKARAMKKLKDAAL